MSELWSRVLPGALLWIGAVAWLQPSPLEREWGHILLLFGPLVLVPMGLHLAEPLGWAGRAGEWLQWLAGLLLTVSFFYPAGREAAIWSLLWLLVTALVAIEGMMRILTRGLKPLPDLCVDAGLVFLFIGGLWATASRSGMHPMGFDDTIVLLTANHFHYAGFVLPIVAGLAARELPGRLSRVTLIGILAGVPLVAIGITATKYGYSPWLECVAALVMAASGLGIAFLHLRLAARPGPTSIRVCWAIAGASLFAGMILAGIYGVRFSTKSDEVLTIPWMRLIHGSINAFGFALAALLGWWLKARAGASATAAS